MKSERARPESDEKKRTKSETPRRHRRHRNRPTPKWLLEKNELDDMARRRCLLVLEVLSGARPVTDAISAAGISRQTYYKLEERALRAMLTALSPGVGPDGTEMGALEAAEARVATLEEKLATIEKERRRSERLNLAIRKLVKPGPVVTGLGRPRGRRGRRPSTNAGPSASPSSTESTTTMGAIASTPTSISVAER